MLRKWTAGEISQVAALNAEGFPDHAIARRLSRHPASVRFHRLRLGLKANWRVEATDAEISEIRALNLRGLNDGDVAERLKRPLTFVRYYRVNKLRLPARGMTPATRRRHVRAIRKAVRADLRGFSSYLQLSGRIRAASLGWPGIPLSGATVLEILRRLTQAPPGEEEAFIACDRLLPAVTAFREERAWRPYCYTIWYLRRVLQRLRHSGLVEYVDIFPSRRARPRRAWRLTFLAKLRFRGSLSGHDFEAEDHRAMS